MKTRNIAQCRLCEDIFESKSNNHFIGCSCGEIMIDGGIGCFSRIIHRGNIDNYINLSEYADGEKHPDYLKDTVFDIAAVIDEALRNKIK
jgi:hypothetical protein